MELEKTDWFKKLKAKHKKAFKGTRESFFENPNETSLDHPSKNDPDKNEEDEEKSERDKLLFEAQGGYKLNQKEAEMEKGFDLTDPIFSLFFRAKIKNLIDRQRGTFWSYFKSLKSDDPLRKSFRKWAEEREDFDEEQAIDFAKIFSSLIAFGVVVPDKKTLEDAYIDEMIRTGQPLSTLKKRLSYLKIDRAAEALKKQNQRQKKKPMIREKARLILTEFIRRYLSECPDKK